MLLNSDRPSNSYQSAGKNIHTWVTSFNHRMIDPNLWNFQSENLNWVTDHSKQDQLFTLAGSWRRQGSLAHESTCLTALEKAHEISSRQNFRSGEMKIPSLPYVGYVVLLASPISELCETGRYSVKINSTAHAELVCCGEEVKTLGLLITLRSNQVTEISDIYCQLSCMKGQIHL